MERSPVSTLANELLTIGDDLGESIERRFLHGPTTTDYSPADREASWFSTGR
jgi:hypothetical protein